MFEITLWNITGHESGHILWPDGTWGIYNWKTEQGLPRLLVDVPLNDPSYVIGGPEVAFIAPILRAAYTKTPPEAMEHMLAHAAAMGEQMDDAAEKFKSWIFKDPYDEVIVTVHDEWL